MGTLGRERSSWGVGDFWTEGDVKGVKRGVSERDNEKVFLEWCFVM